MADGIVNAVAKGFIPTYPCLLARPYDSKNIKNISYPAYSQLKGDGVRGNVIVENGKVSICGRSGRPIELLGCLDDAFVELASHFNYPVVFDGELLVIDINGNPLSRKVGNGIINKAIKGTISEEEANMVQIMLWDAIPLDEFRQGKSAQRYDNRFPLLESALNLINQTQPSVVRKLSRLNKKFTIVPYKIVDNLEQATDHFHELLGQGFEGTILKDKCGYWEDSRSKYLVKMKAEKTCDLELIGYNPGEGKFTGMVGSLIFTSSDRKIEVSVSGFSDLLRQEITDKIDSLIGAIGEIIYNERITSQDKNRSGVDSLFLPRFGCFRNDKFIADSTNEIT
jgi:ATP-dependent DNA ligase